MSSMVFVGRIGPVALVFWWAGSERVRRGPRRSREAVTAEIVPFRRIEIGVVRQLNGLLFSFFWVLIRDALKAVLGRTQEEDVSM